MYFSRSEHGTLSYNHPMGLRGRQKTPSNIYLAHTEGTYFEDKRRYSTIVESDKYRGNVSFILESDKYRGNVSFILESDEYRGNVSFILESDKYRGNVSFILESDKYRAM